MITDPTAILSDLMGALEKAWNTADAAAYGAPFAPDADFVDIRGTAHHGRPAIAGGHQGIFSSIYADSTIRYAVEDARLLAPGCLLGHVRADLDAPKAPPMPSAARATVVAAEGDQGWAITAFHNTLVTG